MNIELNRLIERLRTAYEADELTNHKILLEAADAIEEQNRLIDGIEADNDSLCEIIEAEKKKTWIPVTERFPGIREYVLVAVEWDDDGSSDLGIGFYTGREDCFGMCWRVYEAELGELIKNFRVTHWMPLPEPPRKEAEQNGTP